MSENIKRIKQKEASRRYRENHPNYTKNYYKTHKNDVKRRNENWRKLNQEKVNQIAVKSRRKSRLMVKKILGVKCSICGKICNSRNINYHEINGKSHPLTPNYILVHIKDFLPLCIRCHNTIHYLKKILKKVDIKTILKLVKKMELEKC